MKTSTRRLAGMLCAAGLLLSTPGCLFLLAGVAAGAGGFAYVNGELTRDYPHTQEDTFNASLRAVKEMDLRLVSQARDQLVGKIECIRADAKSVVIIVEPFGSSSSKVRVRVGRFGDKQAAMYIADKIEEQL